MTIESKANTDLQKNISGMFTRRSQFDITFFANSAKRESRNKRCCLSRSNWSNSQNTELGKLDLNIFPPELFN